MDIFDTKMTALADELRELTGTTTTKNIDTMTSDVDATNAEIAEQTELLGQIATALAGKASGTSNIKTCTFKIINEMISVESYRVSEIAYSYLNTDGNVSAAYYSIYGAGSYLDGTQPEITLENVICGSMVMITHNGESEVADVNGTNGVEILGHGFFYFQAPVEAGVTGILTIGNNE